MSTVRPSTRSTRSGNTSSRGAWPLGLILWDKTDQRPVSGYGPGARSGQPPRRSEAGRLPAYSLPECLWSHLTDLNNHVCRHVGPQRCLTNRLGAGGFVQTIRLLAVGAEEREQPLHADIGVDKFDL